MTATITISLEEVIESFRKREKESMEISTKYSAESDFAEGYRISARNFGQMAAWLEELQEYRRKEKESEQRH